jgi:hypothetical protein
VYLLSAALFGLSSFLCKSELLHYVKKVLLDDLALVLKKMTIFFWGGGDIPKFNAT